MIITKGPEEWSFLVFETEFSNFRNYSFPLLELEFRAFGTKVSSNETKYFQKMRKDNAIMLKIK